MSDGITIKIDNASMQSTVEKLAKYNRKVEAGVIKAVSRSALNIQSDARMRVPVASNRLRSSIATRFNSNRMGAVVESNIKYALYVEQGRKPGRMPPSSALEAWVRTKISSSAKEIKSIAFLVARKIGLEGTRAQPFMLPAAKKEKWRYYQAIRMILKYYG